MNGLRRARRKPRGPGTAPTPFRRPMVSSRGDMTSYIRPSSLSTHTPGVRIVRKNVNCERSHSSRYHCFVLHPFSLPLGPRPGILHVGIRAEQIVHRGHAERVPIPIVHEVMPHVVVPHPREQSRRKRTRPRRSDFDVNDVVAPLVREPSESVPDRRAQAEMMRHRAPQCEVGREEPPEEEDRRVDGHVEVIPLVVRAVDRLADPLEGRVEEVAVKEVPSTDATNIANSDNE